MSKPTIFSLFFSGYLACAGAVFGQHDPQRNATQAIATGDFKKAEKELGKADAADPETLFVRTMLALKRDDVASAIKTAEAALDAGLPLARFVAGPRDLLAPLYRTDAFDGWLRKRGKTPLLHGPMLGSVTDTSAVFWMRTATASKLQIKIGDRTSKIATTGPSNDFAATVTMKGLQPDQT